MSHVPFYLFFPLDKVVKLVSGGSVINGARLILTFAFSAFIKVGPGYYYLQNLTIEVSLFRPSFSQSFDSRLSTNMVSACFGVCCDFQKNQVLTLV